MLETVRIELLPLGKSVVVQRGMALEDFLFAQGVEFPCGGRGRCKGCRIRVLAGSLPVTPEDQRLLTASELSDGWRLACRARAEGDLKVELAQWEASILTDESHLDFSPRKGLGVAVDLGTTTLVAQLIDLVKGDVLAVRTALNAQARHGADVMSRIDYSVGGGQPELQKVIREQIGALIEELFATDPNRRADLGDVVLVGNTVMHHLFCGFSVEPLSHYPFQPQDDGLQVFQAQELGWGSGSCTVRFLPCLGGFVGSDILAGILATRLHETASLVALIDLGTNGEIVVGNGERMLCASTAAGPAFEGARISMGMRAATGAISEVTLRNGQFHSRVLGNVSPRGICGSGLVDAVAVGLDTGRIGSTGKFTEGSSLMVEPPVALSQKDVRELQLAKGAIAAGFRILLQQWGAKAEGVSRVYLAGAFGNYISRASARRIGLLQFPTDRVEPAGNTALRGAKLALFGLNQSDGSYLDLRRKVRHISLNEDEQFQETFVEEMAFPSEGS